MKHSGHRSNRSNYDHALAHIQRAQNLMEFGTSLKRKRVNAPSPDDIVPGLTVTFKWDPWVSEDQPPIVSFLTVGFKQYTLQGPNWHVFAGTVLDSSRTDDGDGLDVHYDEFLTGKLVKAYCKKIQMSNGPRDKWRIEIPGTRKADHVRYNTDGTAIPSANVSVEELATVCSEYDIPSVS